MATRLRYTVLALLAVLAIAAPVLFILGFDGDLLVRLLREHHLALLTFVTGAPLLAGLAFMGVYALAVAASLPGIAVLTIAGGYLFGWLHSTAYVQVAATLGATAVFVLARSAIGERLRARAGPAVQRLAQGFRRNALGYGFVMNLVPILPYAVVIGVPAACGVGLRVFIASVFFGLLPGTILFAQLGAGLAEVLGSEWPLRPSALITPQIMLSLTGIGMLALIPILWRARLTGPDPSV